MMTYHAIEYLTYPNDLFIFFFVIFFVYLIVDTLVIVCFPSCVVNDPKGIVLHHILLIPLCIIVNYASIVRYHIILMIGLTTEINTFFIILRRQLLVNSFSYKLCNLSFYITWILLKLILFPIVTLMCLYEYCLVSIVMKSRMNFMMLAPILMCSLTVLTYKWTYNLLSKKSKKA